ETLHAVRDLQVPTLWFWPNVDAGSDRTAKAIRMFREQNPLKFMHFFRNMPPEDFNRLLVGASAIVGNSSAAIRECAYLGTPAVNIGSRQSGRERGPNVIDVDYDRGAIGEAVRTQLAHGRYASSTIYGDGKAGPRIAEALATCQVDLKTPGK
ncbi:MAG TPA: UDP-N-acetylglucosamine 2-epimerase, partial [Thermohalobaculum sp.]|nr:UDP-N-acetylglucosamine 2-epimerase [Thermohalobaculum sp.]